MSDTPQDLRSELVSATLTYVIATDGFEKATAVWLKTPPTSNEEHEEKLRLAVDEMSKAVSVAYEAMFEAAHALLRKGVRP